MTDIRRSFGSTVPATARRRFPWALVLSFLVLGLAGFAGWSQWQQLAGQQEAVRSLQEQVQRLHTDSAGQLSELASLRREQGALQSRLDDFRQSLTPGQRREWLVNETDYYLDLAEQHLQLQQDTGPALRLVELADSLLAQSTDPGLILLRQGLAEDRLALLAAGKVDRPGLSLRLDALKQQALGLTLPMRAGGTQPGRQVAPSAPADASPWEQGWSAFRNLVTIRRYDAPVRPLLSDDQRWLIQQSVYLELTQAQLALWRNQEQRYRQSLADVRLLIRDYAGRDPLLAAIRQELDALEQQTLPPVPLALPHARKALAALKSLHPVTGGEPRS